MPLLKSIPAYAFYKCDTLPTVDFPLVTSIGESAFYYCTSLTWLRLGATPPTVGTNAFKTTPAEKTLAIKDHNATAYNAYKNVNDGDTEDTKWYGWNISLVPPTVDDGLIWDEPTKTITIYNQTGMNNWETKYKLQYEILVKNLVAYSTEIITPDAFSQCVNLATVNAPMLKNISANTFENCTSLSKIALGSTPPFIEPGAFNGCAVPRELIIYGNETSITKPYKDINDGDQTDDKWYGFNIPENITPALSVGTVISDRTAVVEGSGEVVKINAEFAFMETSLIPEADKELAKFIKSQYGIKLYNDGKLIATEKIAISQHGTLSASAEFTLDTKKWEDGANEITVILEGNGFLAKSDNCNSLIIDVKKNIYDITVDGGASSVKSAKSKEIVRITAATKEGYTFTSWSSTPALEFEDSNSEITTFTMPSSDLAITANFIKINPTPTPVPPVPPVLPITDDKDVQNKHKGDKFTDDDSSNAEVDKEKQEDKKPNSKPSDTPDDYSGDATIDNAESDAVTDVLSPEESGGNILLITSIVGSLIIILALTIYVILKKKKNNDK